MTLKIKCIKFLALVLGLSITIFGTSGCVNLNKVKYENNILTYLEAKYDETFEVKKMSRISTIGTDDVIYALCCSDRFPDDSFEVALTLSVYDIYNADEINTHLQQFDISNDESTEINTIKTFIKDNYINVIVQNKFDDKLSEVKGVFVKTQITTANYYLDVPNKNITVDEFFEKYGGEIVVYTSIFVDDEKKLEDNTFLRKNAEIIVRNTLFDQFIFYYATELDSEEIKSLYAENYDNNNEFFYYSSATLKYLPEMYTLGEKKQ